MRIGRVDGATLTAERLREVDEWAGREGLACLYFLADADDSESVHVAEAGGFRLMDLRVELRQRPGEAPPPSVVRPARDEDRERLRTIARTSHGATRFYADPNFPDERCGDLYVTWIERSLDGWAAEVLVAERDGVPVGYCSVHHDEESRTGSIGLIAVDSGVRRGGVGLDLASGAVAWCVEAAVEAMSVVTQGRNVPALRTFQRAGFAISSVELWFHKWYDR